MKKAKRKEIIRLVAAGHSWTSAVHNSGASLEEFYDLVQGGHYGHCKRCIKFVDRLEKAGREATEASLGQHRKMAEL